MSGEEAVLPWSISQDISAGRRGLQAVLVCDLKRICRTAVHVVEAAPGWKVEVACLMVFSTGILLERSLHPANVLILP